MASYTKVEGYCLRKVLPCLRRRFPDVVMEIGLLPGGGMVKVSIYSVIHGFFTEGDDLQIPFNQDSVDAFAEVLSRKSGLAFRPIKSGFLIPCD